MHPFHTINPAIKTLVYEIARSNVRQKGTERAEATLSFVFVKYRFLLGLGGQLEAETP